MTISLLSCALSTRTAQSVEITENMDRHGNVLSITFTVSMVPISTSSIGPQGSLFLWATQNGATELQSYRATELQSYTMAEGNARLSFYEKAPSACNTEGLGRYCPTKPRSKMNKS